MSKKDHKFSDHIQKLNDLHKKAQIASDHLLQYAREAGGLLIEVKDDLPHGQFMKWVEENCDFSGSTARRYMRIHRGLTLGITSSPSGNTTLTSLEAIEKLLRQDDSILEPKPRKSQKAAPTAKATAKPPAEPDLPEWEDEIEGEEYDFSDNPEAFEECFGKDGAAEDAVTEEPHVPEKPKRTRDLYQTACNAVQAALDEVEGKEKEERAEGLINLIKVCLMPDSVEPPRSRREAIPARRGAPGAEALQT